ncbi:hypothetical protein BY996DRAFT_6416982 [Phakopsora pachyrhizi]|nr:hypothetical protein BY996DRAFT_6416982 [Phakopsora pachyrhizi]
MSKENQEESDCHIQAIKDLHQQLSENCYSETNNEDLRDQADELIELYLLENLLSSSAEPHTLASLIYNSCSQTLKSKAQAANLASKTFNSDFYEILTQSTEYKKFLYKIIKKIKLNLAKIILPINYKKFGLKI